MITLRKKKKVKTNKGNYTDPHEPRYADLSICQKAVSSKDSLKVVSYNIEYSKKIDKAIKLLGTHKDLYDADVICLQEMTGDAVEQIARSLDYNYVYYPAIFHKRIKNDFGNATLSRFPITHDEKIILPHLDPRQTQRTAVNTTIHFNKKKIIVSNAHFKVLLRPSFRREQMQFLLKSLPEAEAYYIIAGDFNTFTKKNSSAILDPLIQSDFIPATDGLGWSHKHWTLLYKRSQLDHIFIKGLNLVKTGKVINRKSSDHIPIWAKLSLNT